MKFVLNKGDGKSKPVDAVIGSYHTYFSTGMIPFNPKRPSKRAKAFLKFMHLEWVLEGKKT